MDSFGLGLLLAFICVGVHYEGLSLATTLIRRAPVPHRMRVVVGLIAALLAHIVEVVIFAAGWLVLTTMGLAHLTIVRPSFEDFVYFSFVIYSSLGYGDIVPVGASRLVAGLEALVGLVLIAWTASFTYFEMTLYWDGELNRPPPLREPGEDARMRGPEHPTNTPIV
jgi:hypothetical protein